MKKSQRRQKVERLNLIPIMDAVFIFIFFLLMSAQFVEIRALTADVPKVSTVEEAEKKKEKPLALTLDLMPLEVIIKTGPEGNIYKKIEVTNDGEYDVVLIQKTLMELKKDYKNEKTAIINPDPTVKYKKVVRVIDILSSLRVGNELMPYPEFFPNISFGNL